MYGYALRSIARPECNFIISLSPFPSVAPSSPEVSGRCHHALLFKQYFTSGPFFLFVPSSRSPAAISRFSPRLPFTESSEPPSLLPISATSVEIMHEKATMAISSHNRALFLLVAAAPCIPSETPFALHLQQRPGTDKTGVGSWRSLHRLDDRAVPGSSANRDRKLRPVKNRSRCIPSRIRWSRFRLTSISRG